MDSRRFVQDLAALRDERLRALAEAGRQSLAGGEPPGAADQTALLKIALANEIGVSELAAVWMPSTPEIDLKIALARQAGDEARHFDLVGGRLKALGFDPGGFVPPASNPLFAYLRSLPSSIERIAAGLFTLEAIAYNVNETFMQVCALRGDEETVRIYRSFIQPDEAAHGRLGRELLEKYVTDDDLESRARQAVVRTLEIAGTLRAQAAGKVGTPCFPGC